MSDTATARKQRAITSDRVRADAPAAQVIDLFGGLSRFCTICDFAPGTVHGWLVAGLIPAKWREGKSYARHIIDCGSAAGIEVPADIFVTA